MLKKNYINMCEWKPVKLGVSLFTYRGKQNGMMSSSIMSQGAVQWEAVFAGGLLSSANTNLK